MHNICTYVRTYVIEGFFSKATMNYIKMCMNECVVYRAVYTVATHSQAPL